MQFCSFASQLKVNCSSPAYWKCLKMHPFTGIQWALMDFQTAFKALHVQTPSYMWRHQYTPSELLVWWSNIFGNPPHSLHTFPVSNLQLHFCNSPKLTTWHSHALHAVICHLRRWERSWVWTSFSSSLFSFLVQLILCLNNWVQHYEVYQERLFENVRRYPLV